MKYKNWELRYYNTESDIIVSEKGIRTFGCGYKNVEEAKKLIDHMKQEIKEKKERIKNWEEAIEVYKDKFLKK